MERYSPKKIEKKWQRFWEKNQLWKAKDFSKKKKIYLLVEFPYPSGQGLHVGHCRSYVGLDVLARKKRMEGFNVLFPMGWDAFGLPTENYALKTGIHPKVATKKNTANFKRQLKRLGLSFDWSREIDTTCPDYYKWTQWIFLKLFEHGLAYKAKILINWCPSCKIGLSNEEVIEGKCERCGKEVERREKEQWLLRITKYAERLINDLDSLDFPEKVKILQKEWIGKSVGAKVIFPLVRSSFSIEVFTTRIDTIFGATFLVIAPEYPLIEKIKEKIENFKIVKKYIARAKKKLERERISQEREKTGIMLEGIKAINPATGKEIPIFVADYVLLSYGTGAIMGVPAHDQRDLDFAKKFNLPIIEVIKANQENFQERFDGQFLKAYEGEGELINSGRFSGMRSELAKERILSWLVKKGLAKKGICYRLRDWVFSRQRYWGEPIPLVFCENCKKEVQEIKKKKIFSKKFSKGELENPGYVAISEKDLPLKLPQVKDYRPTEKGDSPLAKVEKWVKTKCPKCGKLAKRETDVMPNWAGSNWYYLRYCDPKNKNKLASEKKLLYWMPVDWYNGGMEHTTLHLLYSRFIYKFLWDIGAVPKEIGPEPYRKRTSHGIILGEGGIKMSKSKGNVINPDEIIEKYGADTLRVYEMFMGPFSEAISWSEQGVKGMRRFLEKVWQLSLKTLENSKVKKKSSENLKRVLHQTIRKVSEDIEKMKFNTALSKLMEFSNLWQKEKKIGKKELKLFLILISLFAPHLAEEIWHRGRFGKSVFLAKWPKPQKKYLKREKFLLLIQINGKVRDKLEVLVGLPEKELKEIALLRPKIKKYLKGKSVKKVVFVKEKLINFVI